MKLKQLLLLNFMKEFEDLLETEFEKKLFVASLRNYASHGNPIRFHNFAFSMRELILYVINRKAPKTQVKKAIWYEVEGENTSVTRRQQLKYCAQKNISDEYMGHNLDYLNETIGEFLKEFNFFNKYTHISEKDFTVCPKNFFKEVESIIGLATNCLNQLQDIEEIVIDAVEDKVREAVISTSVAAIPDCLAALAHRVFVDYTEIDEIECLDIDEQFIYMRAVGSVSVTQEYGPRNDLCTIESSYPFTLDMKSNVNNPEAFTIESDELSIDTSGWYE